MAWRLPYIRIFKLADGSDWSPDLALNSAEQANAPPTPGPAPGAAQSFDASPDTANVNLLCGLQGGPPAVVGMGCIWVRTTLWVEEVQGYVEVGSFEVPETVTLHELRFTYLQTR